MGRPVCCHSCTSEQGLGLGLEDDLESGQVMTMCLGELECPWQETASHAHPAKRCCRTWISWDSEAESQLQIHMNCRCAAQPLVHAPPALTCTGACAELMNQLHGWMSE